MKCCKAFWHCCKEFWRCCFRYLIPFIMVIVIAILAALLIFRSPAPAFGGIQAQLTDGRLSIVSDRETIVFNSFLNNQSSDISYNQATGEFTITKAGDYYVSWWVTTNGSSQFTNMSFSIAVNGVPHSIGTSPIVSGQVSGSELITVGATPATITLINNSSNDIRIANTPVQANIVIIGSYE